MNSKTILMVAALCLSCGVQQPILVTTSHALYVDDKLDAQPCFTSSIDRYTKTLFPGFQPPRQIHVIITRKLSNALGQWTPAHTIAINKNSRQLAVFGHEYVRVYCYESEECDPYQSSHQWTGQVGKLWNEAEDLAREMCG